MAFATDSTTTAAAASSARPAPCKNKCGFFANAQFDGFCSQCYSEERKQFKAAVSNSTEAVTSAVENLSTATTATAIKDRPPRKTRCPNCQKSMGILQYPCACGGCFCSNCRYSNEHRCPVDYKAMGRTLLAKSNPPVIADRVPNRQ